MDMFVLDTLNALLGNTPDAAAIEWALTGGEIEIVEHATFAFAGAEAVVRVNNREAAQYRSHHCRAGDVITIEALTAGRFIYLALGGGIDSPIVMGSRSTYVPGSFGGIDGRRLKNGDTLSTVRGNRTRGHVTDPLPMHLRPPNVSGAMRFIARGSADELTLSEWKLSSTSDRTGYRLSGQAVIGGGSIISEPVCPGTIQLPPAGEPIVLMADAPTVGGYRILGAVITADLGRLAQLSPGEPVSFEAVSVGFAQRELVAHSERIDQIREWTLG
jgi:antagonist of KipI